MYLFQGILQPMKRPLVLTEFRGINQLLLPLKRFSLAISGVIEFN